MILTLALAISFASSTHAATYLLLSQTNNFAAGITNAAKAYTDQQVSGQAAGVQYLLDPPFNLAGTAVDLSLTNRWFSKSLGADTTFTFANPTAGRSFQVILTNGASWTATWPTVTWIGGSAPVLDTGAGKVNVFTFYYDGNLYYGDVSQTAPVKLSAIEALANGAGALTNDGSGTFGYYDYLTATATLTGKTFDAAGTGNVLKQTKYLYLMRPDWGDGTGAVPQTNTFTASGLMHYTFSGNAETNANYVVYETIVPPDIDTSVDMTATFAFLSGGTDTDTVTFHIAYGLGVVGSAYPVTLANIATSPLAFSAVTPTTPASGDYQTTAALTLTGWAASMTAGTPLLISVRRLQDSNDDGQRDLYLRIGYGSTQ